MKKILLVPSAILVCDELKFEVGYIPTAMIPLQGKPILEHIIDKYHNDKKIYKFISCNQGKGKIKNYIDRTKKDCSLIDIPLIKDLGNTIFQSLNYLKDNGMLNDSYLYINFADTIVEPIDLQDNSDFVAYSIVDDPFRWTSFETDSNDKIVSITEKYTKVVEEQKKVFVGVFGFSEPLDFLNCLGERITDDEKTDSFYLTLLDYISARDYKLKRSGAWIDVGHLDTYYDAKKKFINSRAFNYICLDPKTNILLKKSENKKKLIDEINWSLKLPKNVQHIIPRIYDYSTDNLDPYIKMEYVGYPCLTDVYLYGSYPLYVWDTVFNLIFSLVDDLRKYRYDAGRNNITTALQDMYYVKTVDRLTTLKNNKHLKFFFDTDEIMINGVEYKSLEYIINCLGEKLRLFSIFDLPYLNIIHGDLCLPNIFFDVRNKIIKLIDARGRFGSYDIYGDYRYDLAKLRHSVCGHYDLIITDLFEVDVDRTNKSVTYSIYLEDKHKDICKMFNEKIKQKYDGINNAIELLESLLFLSMVPMHSDNLKRQYCMLAVGIKKFNETCLNR